MSYFKIESNGSISVVHEHEMAADLLCRLKNTLIICENSKSALSLAKELHKHIPKSKFIVRYLEISDSISRFIFKYSTDYRDYLGMRVSTAYVHRSHTGDLILKVSCRVRERG